MYHQIAHYIDLQIRLLNRDNFFIMSNYDPVFARKIILDEIFDLALYKNILSSTGGEFKSVLEDLIEVEQKHVDFWINFFNEERSSFKLNSAQKIKLFILTNFCKLFGDPGIGLILEATEIYGIKNYLRLWDKYKDTPLGEAVRSVLEDELNNENQILTHLKMRRINPEKIRNIFLGLNDGLVEMLGAISGFFAALANAPIVLMAGITVAVAGSFSMAAGAFVATSSENEVEGTALEKKNFLNVSSGLDNVGDSALVSALIVGVSYFIGALVPLTPVFLGANSFVLSLFAAGIMISIVTFILAFLSGMSIKKRIIFNLGIL